MSEDVAGASGQGRQCPACAAQNPQTASFCQGCGAKLEAVAPPPPAAEPVAPPPVAAVPPPPVAAAADPAPASPGMFAAEPALDAVADGSARPHAAPAFAAGTANNNASRGGLVAVLIGAVVLVALLAGLLVFGPWGNVFAPPVKLFANRDVQVTSASDASSNVIGNLKRGDPIAGKWTKGPDGQGRWLKVNWPGAGKGFVWGLDLSAKARPDLTPAVDTPKAQTASVVYAEPDAHSAIVDDLSQGEAANALGATGDGWTEVALNAGGVGYVRASALQAAGAGDANADAPPAQIAALAGISHYACSFAPEMSRNATGDTAALAFYFDEGRRCLNHRYAYIPDEAGGAKRVMLSGKDRRATLLYFMPDRRSFYRTDFTLAPEDYARLARKSGALDAAICALPGDSAAAARLQAMLKRATPDLDTKPPEGSSQKRVWRCTPDAAEAAGRSIGGH